MSRQVFSMLFCCLISILSGCANVGSEHYYESNLQIQNGTKDTSPPVNGLAHVFLVNPDLPFRSTSAASIPPKGFAINSNLVAIMPYPSYARLALQPGSYKFNYLTYQKEFIEIHNEKIFAFEANKTYFVKGYNTIFSNDLELISDLDGNRAVKDFPLAKTIHQIIPINLASKKVIWNKTVFSDKFPPKEPGPVYSSNPKASGGITAADVSDFFATVGAIALVFLMIYGMGVASMDATSGLASPSSMLINPPAQSVKILSTTTSVRSASGKTMSIEQIDNTGMIHNISTGVRYRIEGDYITGTDGSRFRSAGSTIFSNSGNYYTRSGNVITSNDGRQCQIIGSLIDCK